jgi:hypothetical protein
MEAVRQRVKIHVRSAAKCTVPTPRPFPLPPPPRRIHKVLCSMYYSVCTPYMTPQFRMGKRPRARHNHKHRYALQSTYFGRGLNYGYQAAGIPPFRYPLSQARKTDKRSTQARRDQRDGSCTGASASLHLSISIVDGKGTVMPNG